MNEDTLTDGDALEEEVSSLLERYRRIDVAVLGVYFVGWTLVLLLVLDRFGFEVALALWVPSLLANLTLFRVEAESMLRTEHPPGQVREAFGGAVNPATVVWAGRAGRIHAPPRGSEEDVRAVFTGSTLGLKSRQLELVVTRPREADLRLRLGRDRDAMAVTDVTVEPDGEGSRVCLSSSEDRVKLLDLLARRLGRSTRMALVERLGYEERERDSRVTFRFR